MLGSLKKSVTKNNSFYLQFSFNFLLLLYVVTKQFASNTFIKDLCIGLDIFSCVKLYGSL